MPLGSTVTPSGVGPDPDADNLADRHWASLNSPVDQSQDYSEGASSAAQKNHDTARAETSNGNGDISETLPEESLFKTSFNSKRPGSKSLKGRIGNYKKRISIGVATVGVAGAMVGGFIAAPSFIINHISTLITDKTSQLQVNNQAKYRRSKFANFTDRFTIDGRRAGALVSEMRRFGYEIDVNTGTFKAPGGSTKSITEAGQEFSEFMDQRYRVFGVPTRSQTWKTKRTDALFKRYNVVRASAITPKPGDLDDPEMQMNKTQYNAINEGSDVDTSVSARSQQEVDEEPDPETTKKNDEIAEALDPEDSAFREGASELAEGKNISEIGGVTAIGDEIDVGYGPNLTNEVLDINGGTGAVGSAIGLAKSVALPLDVGDKACTVNSRLDLAVKVARSVTSIKMMRAALVFVSADDGQRKQEASFDLMMQLIKRVMLSDKAMGNFASSAGYQFSSKGSFNRSLLQNQPAKYNATGKLSGFWSAVRDVTGKIPGCSILSNSVFQIGVGIGSIALSLLAPGAGSAAVTATGQSLRIALQTAVKNFLTRRVAIGIAGGLLLDYSFEQILSLTQLYVQKQLTMAITGQETGGLYSSLLFSGAGVLTKQRFLSAGQVPATATQYAQARDVFIAEKKEEMKNKPLAKRLFDFTDYDSLAYQTTAAIALNSGTPSSAVSNLRSNLASMPSLMVDTLASLTTARASAQEQDELAFDTIELNGELYATDPSGNLLTIMRNDISEIDPDENKVFLENEGHIGSELINYQPKSNDFLKFIELCIESTDQISAMEEGSDEPADCAAKESITQRFYAHLAYLDSLDFIDSSLFPEEISDYGNRGSNQPTGALNAYSVSAINPADGLIQGTDIVAQDTSSLECPSSDTIQDLGIEDEAYAKGTKYNIRLCAVHGVRVNAIIAKQLDDMFIEMANEGFTVRGSAGFRDHAAQVAGWNNGNGSGTYAEPGFSRHQYGTAVDISCQGNGQNYSAGTGRYRDNFLQNLSQYPCLEWVARNSPRYGLLLQCVGQGAQGEIRASSGGCEWWHLSPDGS